MSRKVYYKQGTYKPIHPEKFQGKFATYRSSYELAFFRWLDQNPNVIRWCSERVVIPYISKVDGKVHRYFVDNLIEIREGNEIKKYLVEIKPSKQTVPPISSKRKKKTTIIYEQLEYARNTSKWEAAREWAKARGIEFIIITEEQLFRDRK